MSGVQRVSTGAPWEARVGYCRAVRSGPHVWVAGTVAVGGDGQVHGPGDIEAQARRCIAIIAGALEQVGADLSHVVRTRAFATDMSADAQAAFARAHSAAFGAHPPVATLVGVAALAAPEYLIEIEADAFVSGS
ncbi:Rid family hydrolase [Hyphobacterium marinum]|uniref:Rid family hydrolase n=1 Tax=Hyphobacterium marinum TaxID=3116574 RepID=A0ABU7M1R6_9PROT|nr:Rid family hydrolase [Hyphobacterium sp. Y6023]MEE2567718.1 Rid family hydrolase [Hyphobacterium sp. Y6023]